MKTLRNFVVTGGLLRSNGDQAQVGDTVRLYPYDGDPFLATIEAVAPVNCGQDRAYAIEYDLDVVLRVCDLQDRGDVLDCCGLLEDRVETLEQISKSVRLFGAVADGVTDNAPAFEAALAAGDIYVPAGESFYSFDRAFKCPSNRLIQCAPTAHLRRANGTWATGEAGLVENEDQVNGNSNITIRGGRWDGNGLNNTRVDAEFWPQTIFRFKKIENLTVEDLSMENPLKYSFLAGDVEHMRMARIRMFQQDRPDNGDGIHVCGPANDLQIIDISGDTGDDLISLVTTDYDVGRMTQGDITNVLIDGTFANSGNSCIRLLSATNTPIGDDGGDPETFKVHNVTIKNACGRFDGSGILLDPFVLDGPTDFANITIENCRIIRCTDTQTTAYPVIQIDATVKNFVVNGLIRDITDTMNVPALTVVAESTVPNVYDLIRVTGLHDRSTVDRAGIRLEENVGNLIVDDVMMVSSAGTGSKRMIELINGVTARIQVSNINLKGVESIFRLGSGDNITCHANNVMQDGGYHVFGNAGGTLKLEASNILGENLQYAGIWGQVSGSSTIAHVTNASMYGVYGWANFYDTGAGVNRLVCNGAPGDSFLNINTADSGVILSFSGTDFPVDKTKLTPLDGDQIRDATGLRETRVSGAWV